MRYTANPADFAGGIVRNHVPPKECVPMYRCDVERALPACGFRIENRLPLMVFIPMHESLPPPLGIRMLHPQTPKECLEAVAAQNAAYGEPLTSQAQVDEMIEAISDGVRVIAAADLMTGAIVGAGLCTVPRGGVTELAAIGVVPAYRGRGIATALASALARDAVGRADVRVFLMAAHDAGRRIYERAGFERIEPEIIHISRR